MLLSLVHYKFCHLAQVRNYFGLSQSQLGELLFVSKNTVSAWENGSEPSLSHFLDICNLFLLPYQFFLDYKEESFHDISLCLDIYYAFFNHYRETDFRPYFRRAPVSEMLDFFNDDRFPDFFEWVDDCLISFELFHVLKFLYRKAPFYSVPSRFSKMFFSMLDGGVQNA